MFGHARDAGGEPVFRRGEEDGQEAPQHQIVDLAFGVAQLAGHLQRGNDGEVVGYLLVVEDAPVGLDPALLADGLGKGTYRRGRIGAGLGEHLHGLLHGADVVFRQVAGIGTRIRERLVPFVQRLCQGQRGLGREAETAVGLALQRREVEEGGRSLRGGARFFRDRAGQALACPENIFGLLAAPYAEVAAFGVFFVLAEFGIEPAARVISRRRAEIRVDLPVVARLEVADALFAFGDDCQRGRLHAADRRLEEAAVLAVDGRPGPGAVVAYPPVGRRGGPRGGFQRLERFVVPQFLERLAYGGLRHRAKP